MGLLMLSIGDNATSDFEKTSKILLQVSIKVV